MSDRAQDWLRQAEHDLEHARNSKDTGYHEWACFAAHQAAEKACKAIHLRHAQDAWGHVVVQLLEQLPKPVSVPAELLEKARVLQTS